MLCNRYRRRKYPSAVCCLAAVPVLVLIVVLIVLVLIVVLVVVLVLIVVLILVLVLVIHHEFLRLYHLGYPRIVYPYNQDLSFALKIKLTNRPATIAAVIPPAVALNPPVKIPITPSSDIASLTPFARV